MECPSRTRERAVVAFVLFVLVTACTERRARTQPPDEVMASFIAADREGADWLVLLENVVVYGSLGDATGYYRLRSLDAATGMPTALQLIAHTRDNQRMACAAGHEGIFWCRDVGTPLEMRSVDTLTVVQDLPALQQRAPALADGIHQVLVDRTDGGVRITTGRGDSLILRGARPEVIPCRSGEREPYRYVPIGNRSAMTQTSFQTEAGELWFNGYGKRGYALFLNQGRRQHELLGMTGIDHPGFLLDRHGTPIIDAGLVAVTYIDIDGGQLSFAGVSLEGEARWTVRAGDGVLIGAVRHAGHLIAIVRGSDDTWALSFAIADGKVLWKREL